jgi:hypothetical protein
MTDYAEFLDRKTQLGGLSGFEPVWMPDFLFDFQKSLVEWAVLKGRAALFADTGLGKTAMQLVFAENVFRHTARPVLILTPLCVAPQTVREAEKFGIEAAASRDGKIPASITVTNYEQLHQFKAADFSGVICDESSILKNFDGTRRAAITEFMRMVPYRLLCTATAAPNDYTELGTSSEALGELGHMDMLARFFKNDSDTIHLRGTKYKGFVDNKWSFKAHAETHFWRWVCSWARACRKPSDLGFDDSRFQLPKLIMREKVVKASRAAEGRLFEVSAGTLQEQREESRRTIQERCEATAEILNHNGQSGIAWCQLNDEGKLLTDLIEGAEEVSGADSDEDKEAKLLAFISGNVRCLVTKPKIASLGLNLQHCAHMTFFPSHSFQEFYQGVRRCWRFGQTRDVVVDIVTTEGGMGILANLQRKAEAADKMFGALTKQMNDARRIGRSGYGDIQPEIPKWLLSNKA